MDFKIVIETLIKRFKAKNIDFAFIGGVAVNAAGYSRVTQDIDFLIKLEDADKAHKIMTDLDYKLLQKTDNFALYASDVEIFGRVDFLFAYRETSTKMLKRAKEKPLIDGAMKAKVLKPEDIIGLKIQSIANNPERQERDLLDITNIIKINKDTLNIKLVQEYFALFKKENLLDQILEKTKNA